MKYDAEQFAASWTAACSVSDVAREFGISANAASARAAALRKSGVPLKKYFQKLSEIGRSQYLKNDPTYRSWSAMKNRCSNSNSNNYADYGGRGIRVCDRWQRFESFLSDMGARPRGTSLDRINNDGNYEPGNCRWATPKEQRINQRSRLKSEFCFRGHRKSVTERSVYCRQCMRTGRSPARERKVVIKAFALAMAGLSRMPRSDKGKSRRR